MTERPLLLTLALGNFVLGTGAFVLPALLQPMAADLGVSLSAAGWLMSGYALAYALASPLLTAWTGAWPRRRVLLAGLALIAVGNAALAVAPDLLAAPASTMRQLTTLLRDPGAALALSVTLVFFAGQFVVVTFLGPVVTSAAGVGGGGLSLLLWLFGLAAFAANLLDGALADRVGPAPTIAGLTAASALVLADLPVLDAQPWPAALCLVLWGLTGFAFMTPQQSRLVARRHGRRASPSR
ncbi:MAG TPA: MFS transporter [Geminicoccaceae bacterium]|nr:MFS transporter [Geminicoccaceae bacterium]